MTTHAGRLPQAPAAKAAPARGSRSATRKAVRAFRPRRTVPAFLAALLLTAGGVLAAIEIISSLVDRPARIVPYDRVTDWGITTAWNDWPALAVSGGLALVGLLFLLAGLLPGKPRLVPLRSDDPNLVMGVTKHGLKGAVTDAAEAVDGVSHVGRVKIEQRKVRLTVHSDLRTGGDDLRRRAAEAVQQRLDALAPAPRRTAVVHVDLRKD
ncbi:DUF6286 domain-containing protein [Actinomadura hibisca]|uniref:DUF6286 domain-containing protein n=1 Tax=Actinomadura hibisca TaxID=68565 RepID=UPI00082B7E24|nr:DUF6286 domain-containing protein [Actinomadura hibisca]